MHPEPAVEQTKDLAAKGVPIGLIELQGQSYAWVKGVEAPSPPWSKNQYEILIALPAAFDAAALDGFYVELPCGYNDGEHARIQGQTIDFDGRKWRLVSWHYPDGKPWLTSRDSLESHLVHCRGFFLHRGAVNER